MNLATNEDEMSEQLSLIFQREQSIVWQFLIPLALPIMLSLSACIAIPIDSGDEEAFKDEQLAFIEVGKSTKEDIAIAMSDFAAEKNEGELRVTLTPKTFQDGDWWLYAQTRKETKWLFVAGGYGGGGDAGIFGDVDYRFLLIKFSSNGFVSEYEISSSEGTGCNRQGICVAQGFYNLLAPVEDDGAAKQFNNHGERCGVYLYGDESFGEHVWLDNQLQGSLVEKKKFFFLWSLEQGMHTLTLGGTNVPEQQKSYGGKSIEFLCTADELYFIEIARVRGHFWIPNTEFDIAPVDEATGRREITKRQLLLGPAKSPDCSAS
jgi:hypothetical protein